MCKKKWDTSSSKKYTRPTVLKNVEYSRMYQQNQTTEFSNIFCSPRLSILNLFNNKNSIICYIK